MSQQINLHQDQVIKDKKKKKIETNSKTGTKGNIF